MTTESAKHEVWLELMAAGLYPDPDCYAAGVALVQSWGADEVAALRRIAGASLWTAAWRGLHHPVREADLIRILGFGRLHVEHMITPLRLDTRAHCEVARLGSLANFIVAIYDLFCDSALPSRPLLARPEPQARAAFRGQFFWRSLVGTSQERLLARLIREYYRRLHPLASGRHADPRIVGQLERCIQHMYDAQALTLTPAPPLWALRRKAALPYVVMGLPGWLAVSSCAVSPGWHLRWLYRMGQFFGAIDDTVDLDDDRSAGHPNALARAMQDESRAKAALRRHARRVADTGRRLVEEWNDRVPHQGRRGGSAQAIEIAVCSWFGGPAWRPAIESGHAAS